MGISQAPDTPLDITSRPNFTLLRYFALGDTTHSAYKAQGSVVRFYSIWQNRWTQTGR